MRGWYKSLCWLFVKREPVHFAFPALFLSALLALIFMIRCYFVWPPPPPPHTHTLFPPPAIVTQVNTSITTSHQIGPYILSRICQMPSEDIKNRTTAPHRPHSDYGLPATFRPSPPTNKKNCSITVLSTMPMFIWDMLNSPVAGLQEVEKIRLLNGLCVNCKYYSTFSWSIYVKSVHKTGQFQNSLINRSVVDKHAPAAKCNVTNTTESASWLTLQSQYRD